MSALTLQLAAALLPHGPVGFFNSSRIGGRAAALLDEGRKYTAKGFETVRGRSQRDVDIFIVIVGDPVAEPYRR
jgi:hypothetical protein